MAWTAPKIIAALSRVKAAGPWKQPLTPRTVNTSPRQLSSMEKSGVGNNG